MTSPRKQGETGARNRVGEHDTAPESAEGKGGTPGSPVDLDAVWKALDVEKRVQRNPIGMVAAAAGLGFVIGGGLFRPVFARLVRMGLRAAIAPLAEQAVVRYLTRVGTEEGLIGPSHSEN